MEVGEVSRKPRLVSNYDTTKNTKIYKATSDNNRKKKKSKSNYNNIIIARLVKYKFRISAIFKIIRENIIILQNFKPLSKGDRGHNVVPKCSIR